MINQDITALILTVAFSWVVIRDYLMLLILDT